MNTHATHTPASRHDEKLLTRIEVQDRFGIPKRFLELAAMRSEGPRIVRIGRLVRYRPEDVRRWIEAQAGGACGRESSAYSNN